MNLCTLSNSSISRITLVAIFEVPAFPGIQKISFTEEDLDIMLMLMRVLYHHYL
jgi:hypothetical protein